MLSTLPDHPSIARWVFAAAGCVDWSGDYPVEIISRAEPPSLCTMAHFSRTPQMNLN